MEEKEIIHTALDNLDPVAWCRIRMATFRFMSIKSLPCLISGKSF